MCLSGICEIFLNANFLATIIRNVADFEKSISNVGKSGECGSNVFTPFIGNKWLSNLSFCILLCNKIVNNQIEALTRGDLHEYKESLSEILRGIF